jgi:hypothetical protein
MGVKRINITIDESELTAAQASGESVSGYIRRLIREDAEPTLIKLQIEPKLAEALGRSGMLKDLQSVALRGRISSTIVAWADEELLRSHERIRAISLDMDATIDDP